jgi:arginyl-tRNA synthetase
MTRIREKIEEWAKKVLNIDNVGLAHPKDLKNGDYTLIVNDQNARNYFEILSTSKILEIEKLEFAEPRFINIFLSENFFADSVREIGKAGEKYGMNNSFGGQKTIIEYTDPNPLKEFHIGHLMSNAIGESISRITEWNGAEVKRANYQGDTGIHIACAVWGLAKKGGIRKDGDIKENAKYLGECYAYGATSLKGDENLKNEIQEINKKIHGGSDKELMDLYEWGRRVSLDYFETIYQKLGTKFDYYFFESEVGAKGKEIVLEYVKKGVFEESDGAVVFRGEKYDQKLHTRVFLNSDGLPVYEAKELALAREKYEKYNYDKSVVITGNEINEYFKVLLAAMKEVFPDLARKTVHLSHGMMRLPSGKMSSRAGDVITAESLLGQVEKKVSEKIEGKQYDASVKEQIAQIVAVGAVKYSILRQAIGGDIVFDFDKSISFEGDSGPYLQYSAVRAKSVMEKARQVSNGAFDASSLGGWQTTELERLLYRFLEIVERAGKEYAPHYIATYLMDIAGAFNSFYAEHRIIETNDTTAARGSGLQSSAYGSSYKIALTEAVFHVLRNGLHLLGIKVPEKM